jgi:hypothetical protein
MKRQKGEEGERDEEKDEKEEERKRWKKGKITQKVKGNEKANPNSDKTHHFQCSWCLCVHTNFCLGKWVIFL